jgi:hypothetical protein
MIGMTAKEASQKTEYAVARLQEQFAGNSPIRPGKNILTDARSADNGHSISAGSTERPTYSWPKNMSESRSPRGPDSAMR